MPKRTTTYPDHTLENAVRAAGHRCQCLWEIPGPKDTAIAWMVAYAIGSGVVIVQTYQDSGWDAYSPTPSASVDDTIDDVFERCGLNLLPVPARAA